MPRTQTEKQFVDLFPGGFAAQESIKLPESYDLQSFRTYLRLHSARRFNIDVMVHLCDSLTECKKSRKRSGKPSAKDKEELEQWEALKCKLQQAENRHSVEFWLRSYVNHTEQAKRPVGQEPKAAVLFTRFVVKRIMGSPCYDSVVRLCSSCTGYRLPGRTHCRRPRMPFAVCLPAQKHRPTASS